MHEPVAVTAVPTAEAVLAPLRASAPAHRSNTHRALRRFRETRLASAGLALIVVAVLIAIGAPWIAPFDPNKQDYRSVLHAPDRLHPFGTDDLGRDVLSRTLFGARISLSVGIVAVTMAIIGGLIVGLCAGYLGRWVDEVLMRVMDALQAFPALVLAMAITAALGPGVTNIMFAVGFVAIPLFARLVRAQTLAVREFEFVTAARVLGAPTARILWRHILPNVMGPVTVQASLMLSFAILTEASLSFLGLGVRPPTASWGSMLRQAYQFLDQASWLSIAPGAAIFVTVLALNFMGDGLRAALDPRQGRGKEAS